MRDLENHLSEKRDDLDKQRLEKSKMILRCEKLEAKVLQLQNNINSSDSSKPQVQIRNSSLVDKLKASNAIAQAAAGNGAANLQQKRLLVVKNKVVRSDSANNKQ